MVLPMKDDQGRIKVGSVVFEATSLILGVNDDPVVASAARMEPTPANPLDVDP